MREVILPTGEPLVGDQVRLDVMAESDVDEMYPLLADPEVYANGYVMHRCPTSAQDSRALVTGLFLGRSGRTTYAIRLAADGPLGPGGTLVGTSSLMDADRINERIHIGATFYGRSWWGTAVNPEAKLLLLAHCFDACGYGRVKIQTDALNTRSQAAIAKLGAQREGVLRRAHAPRRRHVPRHRRLQRPRRRVAGGPVGAPGSPGQAAERRASRRSWALR